MNSVEQRLARIADEKRHARKETLIFTLILAVILSCIAVFAKWHVDRMNTIVSTEDVGALLGAEFSEGLTQDTTTVRTSHGTFRVNGTFQTVTGHGAEIRTYANGDSRLCDRVAEACRTLVK